MKSIKYHPYKHSFLPLLLLSLSTEQKLLIGATVLPLPQPTPDIAVYKTLQVNGGYIDSEVSPSLSLIVADDQQFFNRLSFLRKELYF